MERKIIVSQGLKWRKDFNFITVYNFKTDDLYKASQITGDIFQLADGTRTIKEIVDCLSQNNKKILEYSIKEKIIEYINSLILKNILEFI